MSVLRGPAESPSVTVGLGGGVVCLGRPLSPAGCMGQQVILPLGVRGGHI